MTQLTPDDRDYDLTDLETGEGRDTLDPRGPGRGREYDGITPPVGDYDEYMAHMKLLANPVFSSVEETLMFVMPTPQQLDYIMRLLDLGTYQFTADCSWWEVYIARSMPDRRLLIAAVEKWDGMKPDQLDRLPLTREEAREELLRLDQTLRHLKAEVTKHRTKGHLWSALPLLQHMEKSPEERQGYSFEHLLPPLLRKCMQAMYAAMPPGIGFANRQAIASQQLMDLWQASNFERLKEPARARRALHPRRTQDEA